MDGAARSEGCGGSHAVAQPSLELDVTHGTGAVRIGRRFVASES
jgi:hypothetical protein